MVVNWCGTSSSDLPHSCGGLSLPWRVASMGLIYRKDKKQLSLSLKFDLCVSLSIQETFIHIYVGHSMTSWLQHCTIKWLFHTSTIRWEYFQSLKWPCPLLLFLTWFKQVEQSFLLRFAHLGRNGDLSRVKGFFKGRWPNRFTSGTNRFGRSIGLLVPGILHVSGREEVVLPRM